MVELFPCCWLRYSSAQVSWYVCILAILARFRLGTCVSIRSSRALYLYILMEGGAGLFNFDWWSRKYENVKSREPRGIN